jgi:hypothetical protein
VSLQRQEYFEDLVNDALVVLERRWPEHDVVDQPEVVAALIVSDALNGMRKSMLDLSEAVRSVGRTRLG